jgi:hypothetical protein
MQLIPDILSTLVGVILPNLRFARPADAAHLGWMSERWLVEYRARS